jgi:hypothetical protein
MTDPCQLLKPAAPKWATDPDAPLPLGFLPRDHHQPDRFFLGEPNCKAVVLLDPDWRDEPPEEWVSLGAGAWQAVVGQPCAREMAELIAKGWLTAAAMHTAKLRDAHSRIILPRAPGTH